MKFLGLVDSLLDRVARLEAALSRLDPNTDPDAERLGFFPVLYVLAGILATASMFLAHAIQPMEDLGTHAAAAAIVAGAGKAGSLTAPLYEPLQLSAPGSLVWLIGGYFGRAIGVLAAVRACVLFAIVAMPLVSLYALRVFGRSAWPAILSLPLVYDARFVAGDVPQLVACPLMVLSVVSLYRTLRLPTPRRAVGAALFVLLLFYADGRVFLWTLVLSTVIVLVCVAMAMAEAPPGQTRDRALIAASAAAIALGPGVVRYASWLSGFASDASAPSSWQELVFGYGRPLGQRYADLAYPLRIFSANEHDLGQLLTLFAVVALAVSFARRGRARGAPVLELCCIATLASYFFLPDGARGAGGFSEHQLSVALSFLPALAAPLPEKVWPTGRYLVIGGLLYVTNAMLWSWHEQLAVFEAEEAKGLETVLLAAPPRLRLHYVRADAASRSFAGTPFSHVQGLYMATGEGLTDDWGLSPFMPLRPRLGARLPDAGDAGGSPASGDVWKNFDLVLLRNWQPDAYQLREVKSHGDRIAESGHWQLWRSRESSR